MQEFMITQADRLRFEAIIDLYSPPGNKELAGLVKQFYWYHNEIAHPKKEETSNLKLILIQFMNAYQSFYV